MNSQELLLRVSENPLKGKALYGFSYRENGQFVISGYHKGAPKTYAFDASLLSLAKETDAALFKRFLLAAKTDGGCGKVSPRRVKIHLQLNAPVVLELRSALALCLTCNAHGAELAKTLGYAWGVDEESAVCCEADGAIYISGGTLELAEKTLNEVVTTLSEQFGFTDAEEKGCDYDDTALTLAPVIRMAYGKDTPASVLFFTDAAIRNGLNSAGGFQALTRPAGNVFAEEIGDATLFIESADPSAVIDAIRSQEKAPVLVGIKDLGFFACNISMPRAMAVKTALLTAMTLYEKIDVHTPVADEAPCACGRGKGRLSEKIALVTGSAQGFGKGIALAMAEEGAHLIIADLNEEGARACAQELNDTYGPYTAISVCANVGDEESVKAMTDAAVRAFGGLDVLVNNAGIVRAGGLEEMTKSVFELVTSINYTAYFLCTREASRVMKLQHQASPEYMMDIIEINSKSGLSGSNKNFAYAGSKFGGLGLNQSFAMELAPFNVKVNAICPGNLLDGPLWSDPERGLFVQYLKAGKVPGAKTTADVKKFYEAKVPLNRGCREADVARAILYIIEQSYETGQAVPVTGGQEMLN